jgi:N-methylhydantoinase B
MAQRHGVDHVLSYGSALLDYAQSFMAKTIAAMPKGSWSFTDAMDDDGAGNGTIPISATLTIDGDLATVDLRACPDQTAGCINCPDAVARSAVYYCFLCLLAQRDGVPLNGGCFRNVRVLTRPGSVVHAVYPAAVVAGNTETSQRLVDVVLGCLAQALPDRIPAASCGTMSSIALGGAGWTYYETIPGGCGAGPTWHGESAVQCHMTNTLNTPAEAIELQYPLRILRFERGPNTGGAGQYHGGDGVIREIQALAEAEGTALTDRRTTQPYGLAGATPARSGANHVNAKPIPGKSQFVLKPGDVLRITTPGGGGFGKINQESEI